MNKVLTATAVGFLFALAGCLAFTGCISASADRPSRADQTERVPWIPTPPLPPQHTHPSESILLAPFAVESAPESALASEPESFEPAQPLTIIVAADPSLYATGYVLFAAPEPRLGLMQPVATNGAPLFQELAVGPMRFYQMKAVNEFGFSGWATK